MVFQGPSLETRRLERRLRSKKLKNQILRNVSWEQYFYKWNTAWSAEPNFEPSEFGAQFILQALLQKRSFFAPMWTAARTQP